MIPQNSSRQILFGFCLAFIALGFIVLGNRKMRSLTREPQKAIAPRI
jgi:hypothetical protein